MRSHLFITSALSLLFSMSAAAQDTAPKQSQNLKTEQEKKTESRLNKVTVSATFTEKKELETVQSVSIIGTEDIDASQANTVFELLTTLPGVDINGGPNRQGSKVNIRGVSRAEQNIVRIDGITQYFEGYRMGSFSGDPELMKQVDVVRGPVSTLYGSGAIGGVINMTTKDASDFLRVGQTIGAKIKLGFNNVNNEKNGSLFLYGRPTENIDLLAAFTMRDSGDFTQASGETFEGSSVNVKNLLLKASVVFADFHSLGFSFQHSSDNGIVEYRQASRGSRGNGFSEGLIDRELENTNIGVKYAYEDDDNAWIDLKVNFGYSKSHNKETGLDSTKINGPVARALPVGQTRIFDYDSWQVNLTNTSLIEMGKINHTLTYGADYYSQDRFGEQLGKPVNSQPSGTQNVFGIFIQDEINILDRLTLTPAIRYASYKTKGDTKGLEGRIKDPADFLTADMFAQAKTYTAWTPSLASEVKITDWVSLVGGYYRGFRAPAIDEIYAHSLYFGRPVPRQVGFKTTSLNLKEEKATTYEGGVKLNFKSVFTDRDILRVKLVRFENKITNKVASIRGLSALINPLSYINDGEDKLNGWEFEGLYDNGITYLRTSFSSVRGRNLTRDTDLSSTPSDKLILSFGTRIAELNLDMGWQSQFIWQHHTDEGPENPGYNTQKLFMTWTPEMMQGLAVRLTVDNLFNKDYKRKNSGIKSYARDFRISLSYQF